MYRSHRFGNGRLFFGPAFLAVALALALGSLLVAAVLRPTYLREIEVGRERAAIIARLIEERTTHNLQALDFVLARVVEAAQAPGLAAHDAAFRESLNARLGELPLVRALLIIGADGFIRHETKTPATPHLSLADREYFRKHQTDPSNRLHIGPPLMSRPEGLWFVSASRRIDGPDGSFAGVALAAVEPAYYDKLYNELQLGPTDIVSLLYNDGRLIARVPPDPALIGLVRGLGGFREQGTAQGIFTSENFADGKARIVAYRPIGDTQLVAAAALGQVALLANWWTTTAVTVASFLLLATLALMTTLILTRRRIERREARRRAAVAERLQTLGQMTGGIAHDFNNLIAAIGAGLTLAEKSASDPAKLHKHLTAARDTVGRATTLATQLLAFAKRQQLEVKAADANQLLRRLTPMLEQAAGSNVRLTLDLAAALSPCRIDLAQFDVAVLNLVLNARDAMKPGGGSIVVTTSDWTEPGNSPTLRPGRYIRVCVCDTGPGFPEDVLERVFEPFFSTKGEAGTGLGLSQVYGVMQQIGGIARVSNHAGRGAAVELLFPCADHDHAVASFAPATPAVAPAHSPFAPFIRSQGEGRANSSESVDVALIARSAPEVAVDPRQL